MMRDAKIVAAAIASRRAFDKVASYVELSEFTPMAAYWWKQVKEWYDRDPAAQSIDLEVLRERGTRKAPEKQRETMSAWLDDMGESPSPDNAVAELLELKRLAKVNELAAAAHGHEPAEKQIALVEEIKSLLSSTELRKSKVYVADDDEAMFDLLDRKNRTKLAPRKLNEAAGGGAVPGDHIVIFGRPEAGKSLFCINMTAGFLKQGKRVLYIGNEESMDKTKMRVLCNLVNGTYDAVAERRQEALERGEQRGFRNARFVHLYPGTIPEIRELVEEFEPDVLVVDQIRNLGGMADNITKNIERNATELRSLLAEYNLIGVSVTQAGDRTERHGQEPPLYLGMADIDSSRTGLPAQADLLIGLGSNEEMRTHNTRAVSLPKNKLGNTHAGFVVEVDLPRSKVK